MFNVLKMEHLVITLFFINVKLTHDIFPVPVQCKCKEGFSGDKCEKKYEDKCECQNGGSCLASGKCKCKEGYTGDKCEKKGQDDCGCLNGGKCMDDGKFVMASV